MPKKKMVVVPGVLGATMQPSLIQHLSDFGIKVPKQTPLPKRILTAEETNLPGVGGGGQPVSRLINTKTGEVLSPNVNFTEEELKEARKRRIPRR